MLIPAHPCYHLMMYEIILFNGIGWNRTNEQTNGTKVNVDERKYYIEKY